MKRISPNENAAYRQLFDSQHDLHVACKLRTPNCCRVASQPLCPCPCPWITPSPHAETTAAGCVALQAFRNDLDGPQPAPGAGSSGPSGATDYSHPLRHCAASRILTLRYKCLSSGKKIIKKQFLRNYTYQLKQQTPLITTIYLPHTFTFSLHHHTLYKASFFRKPA